MSGPFPFGGYRGLKLIHEEEGPLYSEAYLSISNYESFSDISNDEEDDDDDSPWDSDTPISD